MANGNGFPKTSPTEVSSARDPSGTGHSTGTLHPAWAAFVRYCQELRHGEIECLKIQHGLPAVAEVTKKKVKFS